jgi:alkylhydroperoxidase/carboxymuconolactone decarboxylase family protein YurZ
MHVAVGATDDGGQLNGGLPDMDYTDQLRRLALNDASFGAAQAAVGGIESGDLDPKVLALAQLACLIARGGAVTTYGALTDVAVDAGATVTEIVEVLVGVIPVVGLPRAVAEAPKLALALGYDVEAALEEQSDC